MCSTRMKSRETIRRFGPDVGQAAMLRLTAKHRGIEDAVRLARRDQSIEYTVADAKTHTFRSDHDELRMTYLAMAVLISRSIRSSPRTASNRLR